MNDVIDTVPKANHHIDKTNFYKTLVFSRGFADFVIAKSRRFNKHYVICNKKKFFIQQLIACIIAISFISFMIIVPPYALALTYKILIAMIASAVFVSFFMAVTIIMLKGMPFLPILAIDNAKSSLMIFRRRNIDLVQIKGNRFSMPFSEIKNIKIIKTTRFLQPDGVTNWGASGYVKFIYLNSEHDRNLIFITTYGTAANKIVKLIASTGEKAIVEETRNYMERYAIDRDTGIIDEQALKRYSGTPLIGKRFLILFSIALVIFVILFTCLFLCNIL